MERRQRHFAPHPVSRADGVRDFVRPPPRAAVRIGGRRAGPTWQKFRAPARRSYRAAGRLRSNGAGGGRSSDRGDADRRRLRRSEETSVLTFYQSMIFSENRFPPRIKSGAGFFGIMLVCGIMI